MGFRALILAIVFPAAGCVWFNGPDCGAACDKAASCSGLNKTFFLSCNTFLGDCTNQVASCASCIDRSSTTCDGLKTGVCDSACVVPLPDASVPDDAGP